MGLGAYDAAIVESGKDYQCRDVDLDVVVHFIDGDTLISDSSKVKGGLLGACKDFKNFCGSILGLSYANDIFYNHSWGIT